MKKYGIEIILVLAFALTVMAHGIPTPVGFLSISTIAAVLGLIWVFNNRMNMGRPLVPVSLLTIPVVIASFVYFGIGLASIVFAEVPAQWFREVVQRTIIIWLPMFLFALMPRKPEHLKIAILAYLPVCAFLAVCTVWDARHHGFAKPSYALGMHKNHIAGSCSVMATIAIAALLTTSDEKRKLWMRIFLFVAILGCVGSQGKAGMCCVIVGALFMLIAQGMKVKNIVYLVTGVLIVGGILYKVMPDEAVQHVVSTKKFSTNEIRMSLWTEVLPVVMANPFRGVAWGHVLVDENQRFYGDCANVLLFDWFQMSVFGPIALLVVIFFAVKLPLDNARRTPRNSLLAFINLVALGTICGRFFHGMVDTFWIGRGVTLVCWASIGMTIFVKLYLDQLDAKKAAAGPSIPRNQRLSNANRTAVR